MKKGILYLIAGIGILILLTVGYLLGAIETSKRLTPQAIAGEKIYELISSKVTIDLIARGKIEKIEGRNLFLDWKGAKLTLFLKENAKIVDLPFFILGPEIEGMIINLESPYMRTVEFKDLKVGDWVEVYLNVKKDGSFEGKGVLRFPPPALAE